MCKTGQNEEHFNEAYEHFQLAFKNKYLIDCRLLGAGAYGKVFRGFDNIRKIPVCIKFFIHGSPPKGADRDWHITSKIKHLNIADTFTIESFKTSETQRDCVAVISRFIEGKDLGEVFDKIKKSKKEIAFIQKEQLLKNVIPDVCDALIECHRNGYGHGDLHKRNIIVCKVPEKADGTLKGTVIDFGNASFSPDSFNNSEEERRKSDIRALRRIVGCVTVDSKWHEAIQDVLQPCDSPTSFKEALKRSLLFLGDIENTSKEYFDKNRFIYALRCYLPAVTGGEKFAQALRMLYVRVAEGLGLREVFNLAVADLQHRILNDSDYPNVSFSATAIKTDEVEKIYALLKD